LAPLLTFELSADIVAFVFADVSKLVPDRHSGVGQCFDEVAGTFDDVPERPLAPNRCRREHVIDDIGDKGYSLLNRRLEAAVQKVAAACGESGP
jgi:hypothetical protein